MKDSLAGIVSMLETGGPEQQVAAAQVLAWLKPRAPVVVKALGQVATEGESFLRTYAVDALGAIGSPTALAFLIPLLHADGPLRDSVARTFSKVGAEAEKVLVREFDKADPETRRVILEILAQIRGPDAMRTLLGVLREPGMADLARYAAASLRTEILGMQGNPHDVEKLRKSFLGALTKLPKKAPASSRAHLIELLALVADQTCRSVFFAHSAPTQPPEVRAAALHGLAKCELTAAQVAKILGFLNEDDFVNVVGPSLEVLAHVVPSGSQLAGVYVRLLDNSRPEVRLFALKGLGHFQTTTAARTLMPFLESPDARVRALASQGLGQNPEAREGLVKMFLAGRDLEEAGRPLEALQSLAPRLTAAQVKKIAVRFMKLLDNNDPVRDYCQRILAGADPSLVQPLLLEEAKKLRGQGRYDDAMRVLQTMASTDRDMHPDVRYELALTLLQRRGRDPETSEGDPAIGHFCHLIRSGYGLLARLKRERSLPTANLLYLGHRFVERLNDERRLGTDLLTWLIKKAPEGKEAVQALQKLKVEGLA